MRASIGSIILAGGMLALGACAQSGPMTLAERTEHCDRLHSSVEPTGRQTGDARQDYRCRNIQATTYMHGRQNSSERAAGRARVIRRGG